MKRIGKEPQPTPERLSDQVRDALRLKHYSYHTQQAYIGWVTRYVLFHLHHKFHPKDMRVPEVETFRSHSKAVKHVAAVTFAACPAPIAERPTTH